jgi:hypothetical protein
MLQSGMTVGVRETRRVLGDYILTADDVLSGRSFEDAVARGSYLPSTSTTPTAWGTIVRRLPLGGAYDIPLRALTPRGLERLLVSGRCISGTHEAHSSYRVTPIAMATGHAAGICAALAAARCCATAMSITATSNASCCASTPAYARNLRPRLRRDNHAHAARTDSGQRTRGVRFLRSVSEAQALAAS